jgi:inner membrane protein
MASVGHVAVGMLAARVSRQGRLPLWSSMAWWSALSLLPDADVIGFSLGVEYGDPWGHRGATHSLPLAIALGLAIGLAARWFKRPVLRTALMATAVLASHGLLDTMTDGRLGCALLWPFDLTRYFAPWRPIPVAPIGAAFFSPYGGFVALTEVVLFGPVLLLAWRSRSVETKSAALFLALWLPCVWFISSGDPIRDAIVGYAIQEDTAYASGFSERAFRAVTPGESEEDVRQHLGAPFSETWFYTPKGQAFKSAAARSAAALVDECLFVRFETRVVVRARDPDVCKKVGVEAGASPAAVIRLLGPPPESCVEYTRSPGGAYYRLRAVCFENGKVANLFRQWQN